MSMLALLAAFTIGIVLQGGFYTVGRIVLTILTMCALAAALWSSRPRRADADLVLVSAAAIAAWTLIRAVTAGGPADAAGTVAALATVVAALLVLRRTGIAARTDLARLLVGAGVLVAVTGWCGVAWRIERWAVPVEQLLWRASSTLTYSNAAAAVLVPIALLALGLAAQGTLERGAAGRWSGPAVALDAAAYLLVTGVGATLSRAAALAFTVGLVVLVAVNGAGRHGVAAVLRHAVPACLGAAVAVAALVPSFSTKGEPRPLLAVAGLLLGGAVALLPPRLPGRVLPALGAIGGVLAGGLGAVFAAGAPGGGPVTHGDLRSRLDAVVSRRLTFASSGRSGSTGSALDHVAAHPILGSGPGQARYFYLNVHHELVAARFVHNEYLQWLVDLGGVGLLLLAVLGAALVLVMRRGRTAGIPPLIRAGALAAFAALALHSGFDFLWHVAVLPLLGGILAGLAGPLDAVHSGEFAPSPNGEETQ